MNRILRNREGTKKWAVALAVVFALVTCSATAFSGLVANDDPTADKYNNPISIRKTVSAETPEYKDYKLTLSAEGFNWEVQGSQDVYAVFVIDATSSMTDDRGHDIPKGGDPYNSTLQSRRDTAQDAAKAYLDAFFANAESNKKDGERHAAVISFGYSARIHVKDGSPIKAEGGGVDFGPITVESNVKVKGDTESIIDHFIGREKKDETQAELEDSKEYFNKFGDAFDKKGATKAFFYNDPATLKGIVENISEFGSTNIESGLLAADFLVRNLPEDAKKYVFLITDGEANASSSAGESYYRFMYGYNESGPLINELLTDDETTKKLTTGSAFVYSLERVFNQIADKASNDSYISKLIENDRKEINFFAAKDPLLASGKGFTQLVNALTDEAKAYDNNEDRLNLNTWEDLRAYLGEIDKLNWSDENSAFDTKVKDFAEQLFWLAEKRTPYYSRGDIATSLITDEDILLSTLDYKMQFDAVFPNGKNPDTFMYDYVNRNSENVTGSQSAKSHMLETASAPGLLKQRADTTVYAVGIGNAVYMPENLNQIDSSGNAIICKNGLDPYDTAQKLQDAFVDLGRKTSLETIDNVTIRDEIKRRVPGADATDDDTFTVDTTSFDAKLYYYDEDGASKTKTVSLFDDSDKPLSHFSLTDDPEKNYEFSWNAGPLYSQAFAKTNPGDEHPYKAELTVRISANEGVHSAARDEVADIPTNISGGVSFDGPDGLEEMEYPVPKIYIPAPTEDDEADDEDGDEGDDEEEGNEGDGEGEEDEEGNEGDGEDEEGNGDDEGNEGEGDEEEGNEGDEEDEEGGSGNNGGGGGSSGGGDGVTPPSSTGNEDADGDEDENAEEDATANTDTDTDTDENADESTGGSEESEEPGPSVPPGTPVQPGTPDVPPVPYYPGSSLVPLDDGGFLEIDEEGVPLGVWEYDNDEEAWIFDEEVPLALLPQTGGIMPSAGAAYLWVFPLLALLWLGFVWPRLRRYIGARGR